MRNANRVAVRASARHVEPPLAGLGDALGLGDLGGGPVLLYGRENAVFEELAGGRLHDVDALGRPSHGSSSARWCHYAPSHSVEGGDDAGQRQSLDAAELARGVNGLHSASAVDAVVWNQLKTQHEAVAADGVALWRTRVEGLADGPAEARPGEGARLDRRSCRRSASFAPARTTSVASGRRTSTDAVRSPASPIRRW